MVDRAALRVFISGLPLTDLSVLTLPCTDEAKIMATVRHRQFKGN
jgi:hypothetical protein